MNFGIKLVLLINICLLGLIIWTQIPDKTTPNEDPLIHLTDPIEKVDPPLEEPKLLDQASAKETITADDCYEKLGWLADDAREGRMSGKRGNVDSANYIADNFDSLGFEVLKQRFSIRRMNPGPKNERGDDFTENIIGILKGKSDRQIIIGAHMDHIGYGPQMSRVRTFGQIHNGADDNASGTASVMEIAEAFSKMEQPNHTLVFICFSGEEMGLLGSRHYVSELSQSERDNIDLMVNFDMVGWLKDQTSIKISGISRNSSLVDIVESLDDNYDFTAQTNSSASGGSDHAPFGNAGVPFAFFHTGGHAHYHTPTDDVDRIDFEGMAALTQFAFEMINEFDDAQLVRKAAVTYPHLNDTVHDHGHPEVPFPIENE
jgi:hypothetical protein